MKYLHTVVGLSSMILSICLMVSFAQAAPVPALNAPGNVPDFGTVVDSATIRLDNTMTLEAWVYPTAWRSYSGREKHGCNFMYKGRIGSHNDYIFTFQENGILCLGQTRGYIGVLDRRVPLNQWTHVAVSVNEATGSFVFYINGVNCGAGSGWQGASLDRTAFLSPSSNPLYVGGFNQLGWPYNNDNFIGKLADVRIWNVVRTPAEIAANYQKQLRGNEAGLGAYWTFADRFDKTPNGNHMTLSGAAALQAGQGPALQGAGGVDVQLTSPSNNQIVAWGAPVNLAATATSSATVFRVDFYANGSIIGSATNAPFTAVWTNVPAGVSLVSAWATNTAGQVGSSADVMIRMHGPFGGAPATVPGRVEAENFDLGGQGLGYIDTTAANEGAKFRLTEGVDISADAGASNGFVVGWTKAGEWMSYLLNVASNGSYSIRTRVAAVGAGGQFRILINGVDVSGALSVPNTGAWNAYQWVTRDGVELTEGLCSMRVVMVANGASGNVGAFDTFMIGETPPAVQEAYPAGVPWAMPGTVQCEYFDLGGAGLAYNETTVANEGGQCRAQDGVDIAADVSASNGFVVGWTKAGEWMEYTVNLGTPGAYAIGTRVAGLGSGGQFQILIDGVDATGVLAVPNTGAWSVYQVVTSADVNLTLGVHTVRVEMVTQGASGNVGAFDWFRIGPSAGGPIQLPFDGDPIALPGVVQAEKFDAGGQGLACSDTTTANLGGVYRLAEGVDIAAHAGASNGFIVGWTQPGEWMEYTVNVTTAGTYNLAARLGAQGTGGRFQIEVAGATRTVAVPNTGGWFAYQDVAVNGLELTSGIHTMRVSMVQNGTGGSVASFDQFAFIPAAQHAYPAGVAWLLPGVVQAENFDLGGAEVAYHDATPANLGARHRLDDGVDIAADPGASNGLVVGWTPAGEWMEYTVNLAESGTYTLQARVAGVGVGGQFRILVNGEDKTGLLNVPHTGAWNSYQIVQKTGVILSSGIQTLRLEMVTAGASGHVGAFDYLSVVTALSLAPAAGGRDVIRAPTHADPLALPAGALPLPVEVTSSREDKQPLEGWLAVDGDTNTAWQAIPGADGWWLALTFDAPIALNGVTVDWASDSPTNVQYVYSLGKEACTGLELPLTDGPATLDCLWLVFPDSGEGVPAIREIRVE
jgi:hypothetical protein